MFSVSETSIVFKRFPCCRMFWDIVGRSVGGLVDKGLQNTGPGEQARIILKANQEVRLTNGISEQRDLGEQMRCVCLTSVSLLNTPPLWINVCGYAFLVI